LETDTAKLSSAASATAVAGRRWPRLKAALAAKVAAADVADGVDPLSSFPYDGKTRHPANLR